MRRYLVSALGILFGFGLLALQPRLFLFALIGVVVGGIGALIAFYQSRPRAEPSPTPASETPTTRAAERWNASRIALPVRILALVALSAALVATVAINLRGVESTDVLRPPRHPALRHLPSLESHNDAGSKSEEERPSEGTPFHRPERAIAAIPYVGDFDYEDAGGDGPHWHVEETVRVARAGFAHMSVEGLATTTASSRAPGAPEPAAVRHALAPEWSFTGDRAGGRVVAYRRVRNLPIDVPFWPPTHEAAIEIGAITSDSLAVVLVPRNGSRITMHAPANLVRETDPPAERRQFGDEDILTVELAGLEDDADQRILHLEIAGWIGRSSIYGAVDGLTAWTIVKLLFAGVPGALVAFFVTRRLKRRFPDPPTPQPI